MQLVDSRFDWAHAFHEFGRVLPTQTSISSLNGSIGTGGSAGASSSGSASASAPATGASGGAAPTFTLSGCATSQSAVALTLERLRLIDGVREVTLQSSNCRGGGQLSVGRLHRAPCGLFGDGHLRSASQLLDGGRCQQNRL